MGAGPSAAPCRVTSGIVPGVKAVRATVEGCAHRGIEALTIFAFSSENWQRPPEEVTRLMELFVESIARKSTPAPQRYSRPFHR